MVFESITFLKFKTEIVRKFVKNKRDNFKSKSFCFLQGLPYEVFQKLGKNVRNAFLLH